MATKSKKNTTISLNKTVNAVKEMATKTNDFALKSTEEVVTEMIGAATKWQNVTSKAMKGGLKMVDAQQNMVFETLETAKGQFLNGVKKSKAFFSKN